MVRHVAVPPCHHATRFAFPLLLVLGIGNIIYGTMRCGQQTPMIPAQLQQPEERVFPKTAIAPSAPKHERMTAAKRRTQTILKHHKKGNPSLLIHVGPSNTWGSELEDHVLALSSEFAQDKMVVADPATVKSVTDLECHKRLHHAQLEYAESPALRQSKSPLKDYLVAKVPCWKQATEALKVHKEKGESLIMVDQELSKRIYPLNNLSSLPLDLIALETLSEEWNIEILVVYRRFSEWLPDAVEEYSLNRQMAKSPLEPMFPDIIRNGKRGNLESINATYVDTLVDRYSYRKEGEGKIPVTILNGHLGPVGQTLACTILKSAKHACLAAKKRKLPVQRTLRQSPAQANDFYEFIIADVGRRSAYKTKTVTPEVAAIAVKYYQETLLKKTAADFHLKCPSKSELKALLDFSLALEMKLLPEYAQVSKKQHRKEFWEASNAGNRLCHVDVRRLLHEVKFREYVRFLPRDVPKELLPLEFRLKKVTGRISKAKAFLRDRNIFGKARTVVSRTS